MCIDCMQTLLHLHEGLGHSQILVFIGVWNQSPVDIKGGLYVNVVKYFNVPLSRAGHHGVEQTYQGGGISHLL